MLFCQQRKYKNKKKKSSFLISVIFSCFFPLFHLSKYSNDIKSSCKEDYCFFFVLLHLLLFLIFIVVIIAVIILTKEDIKCILYAISQRKCFFLTYIRIDNFHTFHYVGKFIFCKFNFFFILFNNYFNLILFVKIF